MIQWKSADSLALSGTVTLKCDHGVFIGPESRLRRRTINICLLPFCSTFVISYQPLDHLLTSPLLLCRTSDYSFNSSLLCVCVSGILFTFLECKVRKRKWTTGLYSLSMFKLNLCCLQKPPILLGVVATSLYAAQKSLESFDRFSGLNLSSSNMGLDDWGRKPFAL